MNKVETTDCQSHRPYRLKNTIQHYSWGSRNDQAFIAHLQGITPAREQPFAELWMGTHPNAPSYLIDPQNDTSSLADWIAKSPHTRLSLQHANVFPDGLPYLLKVLSAGQALSIQAHPDQQQAKALHKNDPQHYPDNNHKPEIAIAIDHLDALIGFCSPESFSEILLTLPELHELLNYDLDKPPELQSIISALLELGDDQATELTACISHIASRLQTKAELNASETLFLEQGKQHGKQDIGLLFIFFLNRVHLGPGEAVFLPPGVPHAYLKGNIIECMANSDNVVRLGLTKKFCDSQALLQILNFDQNSDFRVKTSSDGYLKEYLSPTKEFRVKSLDLLQGESRAFSYRSALTLFLVLEGEISLRWGPPRSVCLSVFRRGDSFITPANLQSFNIQAKSHSKLFLVDIPNLSS